MGVWDQRFQYFKYRKLLKVKCPGCGTTGTLREIIYGMPSEDFNHDRYIVGGCISEESTEIGCLECEWAGLEDPVARQIQEQLQSAGSEKKYYPIPENFKNFTKEERREYAKELAGFIMGYIANRQCPVCRSSDIQQKWVTTKTYFQCNSCGERFE